MGLLFRSLAVLWLLVWFPWLYCCGAQSFSSDTRALDALLQDYAYKAFVRPKTGVVFDAMVPSNLTGIKVSGLRLRSGSMKKRGVPSYKEFEIPKNLVVQPYVERLILVYQNLGNWSSVYYPLSGYTYLAPVLGLRSYDAKNLSAMNLPELDIMASESPIKIHFANVRSVPKGSVAKCVWFDLQGVVNFSNVVSDNTCSTTQQGHFALVIEAIAPAPAPEAPGPSPVSQKKKKKKNMKKIWIIIGSIVGGVLLLVLLGMLLAWFRKYQQRKKMEHMEKASEVGEALRMTTVGSGKAPAAMVTRTQPTLETEYAP